MRNYYSLFLLIECKITGIDGSCVANCDGMLMNSDKDACVQYCPLGEFLNSAQDNCIKDCPENEFINMEG